MNEQELKTYLRELMEPLFDTLVNIQYEFVSKFQAAFPEGVPEDFKKEHIEAIVKSSADTLAAQLKTISAMDIAKIVKEGKNGKR